MWTLYTDTARTDGDDATRTATVTTPDGQVTTRPYTEAENAVADEALADAATLTDLAARVARIEAHLWPADPDPEPDAPIDAPTWGDYGGIWPNGQLLSDGGTVWRNVSGVPLTTPPSGFPGQPGQWVHLFVEVTAEDPDPEPEPDEPGGIAPWAIGVAYEPGDRVTHDGKTWEAKIAHTSHDDWMPSPATHAVWTLIP